MIKKLYRSMFAAVAILLLACGVIHAQERVVTGTVKDKSGQPVIGTNILKKGTAEGTTTDTNGKFAISASDNDVLVFSFIGYASQEIRVGAQTAITVSLDEDVATLSEVVVVGYGTQKKSDLTGAIS